jgi:hypothetical protein
MQWFGEEVGRSGRLLGSVALLAVVLALVIGSPGQIGPVSVEVDPAIPTTQD